MTFKMAARDQRIAYIVIDIVLAVAVIIAVAFLLYYRNDLKECEENESLFCPQFTCPYTVINPTSMNPVLTPAVRSGPGRKVSTLPFINT